MSKKIFQKPFSKIIFLIFIFSFIQIFLMKEKSYAFKVATTSPECTATTTTQTLYVVSDADRTGTLPVCYSDTLNDSVYIYLTSEFSTPIHSASTTGAFQYYNHNITLPLNYSETKFILKDIGNQKKDATFALTLLPATIVMTVSTSTAGYNYNAAGTAITGSYNDKIVPYLGPYQLKYGEQLNFSCDKTTKMALYSSAKNNTLPLLKDLSASNNYSSNQILKNRCLYVFICFY